MSKVELRGPESQGRNFFTKRKMENELLNVVASYAHHGLNIRSYSLQDSDRDFLE